MALYQPSNITPSSFAGIGGGVVDANDPVRISWQVNGTSGMRGFLIKIFENTAQAPQVGTSITVSLTDPFYGTDENGNVQFYVYEPGVTWASKGIENGKDYKFTIDQSWYESSSSGTSHTVYQTTYSAFSARAKPSVSVSPASGTLSSVRQTFVGTASTAGVPLAWVRWVLSDSSGTVLDDTGTIYTGKLSYTYDGFFSGQTYTLSCTIETGDGVTAEVQNTYAVSYESASATGGPSITCNPDDSVTVTWGLGADIPGVPSAQDYGSILDGVLHLAASRSVSWSTVNGEAMSFPYPYAFAWKGKIGAVSTSDAAIPSGLGRWEEYSDTSTEHGYTDTTFNFSASDMMPYQSPDESRSYYSVRSGQFGSEGDVITDVTVLSSTGTGGADARVTGNQTFYVTVYNNAAAACSVTVRIRYKREVAVVGYRNTVTGTAPAGSVSAELLSTTADRAEVSFSEGRYTVIFYNSTAQSRSAMVRFTKRVVETHSGLLRISGGGIHLRNTAEAVLFSATGQSTVYIPIPEFTDTCLVVALPVLVTAYFWDASGNLVGAGSAGIALPEEPITEITLSGEQYCDYVYITSKLLYPFFDRAENPVWDGNTLFYASFTENLQGGTVGSSDSLSAALYRRSGTTLTPIGTFGQGISSVTDWGIRSLHEYTYVLYYVSAGTYSSGMTSDSFCRAFRQYTLIEAEEDPLERNVFHPVSVWKFRNNIEAGAVSNGNTPALLDNFTKYPLWQPSAQAPRSGTLTALLSYFSEGEYLRETAEDMDALYALSSSSNPLFLRDMKGNLYMVRLSGPVSQTQNVRSGMLEVTVSVPWIEVGDASDAKILETGE